ncbi:MAG: GNAT family N-acetyltransferase [Gammaproteobacteria bacterium]
MKGIAGRLSENVRKNFVDNKMVPYSMVTIGPDHDKWKQFILISVAYINRYWPQSNVEVSSYDAEMRKRFSDGPRLIFLVENSDSHIVGFSNCYIENDDMYISEFHVKSDFQKKGIGAALFGYCRDYAEKGCFRSLQIEVDKDQDQAVAFWSTLGLKMYLSGDRLLFSEKFQDDQGR